MPYPKPLSAKSIEKLFSTWDPHTVEVLHTYYEAFANLYGVVQLKDAWKIFKRFEPKIRKQQFLDFSAIARREDVPYFIFEVNEIYSAEKPYDKERFIVHKDIVDTGYGKFRFVQSLYEESCAKPLYDLPDILEAAAHRLYDRELKTFLKSMVFPDGEYAGKHFYEAVILTKSEQSAIDYYANNKSKLSQLIHDAYIPVSEKIMHKMIWAMEFSVKRNPLKTACDYLNEIDFAFESEEQAHQFFQLVQDFANNSHLWRNCGYTPIQLQSIYSADASNQRPITISLGDEIQKAIQNDGISKEELIQQLREKGFDVIG